MLKIRTRRDIPEFLRGHLHGSPGSRVRPPLDSREQSLPLYGEGGLSWDGFEYLCWLLAREDIEVDFSQRYGVPGQGQGGIDIVGRSRTGAFTVYECKARRDLKPADIRKAVERFLDGKWAAISDRFVLCLSGPAARTDLANEVLKQRAVIEARYPKIRFEVWGAEEISAQLKKHPHLVGDIFGKEWQKRFAPVPGIRERVIVVLTTLAAVVVVTLGLILGRQGETRSEIGRDFRVLVPREWQSGRPPRIPGLRLSDQVVARAVRPAGAGVVVGLTKATGPTLLDRQLLADRHGQLGPPEVMAWKDMEGYRYSRLRVAGSDLNMNITAVPATGGVRTVVCYSRPADAREFDRVCARIVSSLDLREGRPLPLEPIESYAQTLSGTFKRLNKSVRRWGARLDAAKTDEGRASAAQQLERAYRRAGDELRDAVVSPVDQRVNDGLVAAIERAREACDAMAVAALPEDPQAFNEAADRARLATGELERVRARLAELGHQLVA